jgi:hypothetical protein
VCYSARIEERNGASDGKARTSERPLVPKGGTGLGCFAIQQKLLANNRGRPDYPPKVVKSEKKIRADLGEAFLRKLFVDRPLNIPIDQLIRHAAREVDPLVSFVGRKIRASIIVVVDILTVGTSDYEQKNCKQYVC